MKKHMVMFTRGSFAISHISVFRSKGDKTEDEKSTEGIRFFFNFIYLCPVYNDIGGNRWLRLYTIAMNQNPAMDLLPITTRLRTAL
jgi:hypothetical protein